MTLANLVANMSKRLADNAPVILTAIGVTGTITTAVLAANAGYKAGAIIDNEQYTRDMRQGGDVIPLTFAEKVSSTWTLYIPAVGMGVLTVSCIIGANRIGARRAAAMAAAYSISERAFLEYRDKVVERLGDRQEERIRDDVAQDRVAKNPVSTSEIIVTGNGDVLCYDTITGRYFKSSVEKLRKVQNDLNYEMINTFYQSLNDLFNLLNLPTTPFGEEVGWNSAKLLEFTFSGVLTEDGQPCIAVTYNYAPIRGYYNND